VAELERFQLAGCHKTRGLEYGLLASQEARAGSDTNGRAQSRSMTR
jgi:hypothetical protein